MDIYKVDKRRDYKHLYDTFFSTKQYAIDYVESMELEFVEELSLGDYYAHPDGILEGSAFIEKITVEK